MCNKHDRTPKGRLYERENTCVFEILKFVLLLCTHGEIRLDQGK